MDKKPREEKPFKTVKEIEIEGNIANIDPVIASVADELHYKNHSFSVRSIEDERTSSFGMFYIYAITPDVNKEYVGTFTLHLFKDNRVVLRIPPPNSRKAWHYLSATEKIELGLRKKDTTKEEFCDDLFKQFVKTLENSR